MAANRYCRRCGYRLKPHDTDCHEGEPVGPDRMGSWPGDTFTLVIWLARCKKCAPVAALADLLGWEPARIEACAVSLKQPDAAVHSPLLFVEDWRGGQIVVTPRALDALDADNGDGGE